MSTEKTILSAENVEFLEQLALQKGPAMLQRLHDHLDRARSAPSYLKLLNSSLNKDRKKAKGTGTTSVDLEGILPPVGAIFYTDVKPGKIFTQNNVVFIEGINVNTSNFSPEELSMFWWKPLTDPRLSEVLLPFGKILENWHQYKFAFSLGSYQGTQFSAPESDIHPAIVAAGLQSVYKPINEQ